MKLFFPFYYKEFRCIADRCRHSCCVGWDIAVDPETEEKYRALDRADILSHINDGYILLSDGRCPFLDNCGLCRLISEGGEAFVSEICRNHPRFFHRVCDRIECGIGASCEEAARIILSSDEYDCFYASDAAADPAEESDYDALSHRGFIYSVLKDRSLSYKDRLDMIRRKYYISLDLLSLDSWNGAFSELEYLSEEHRRAFCIGGERDADCDILCERFFAYLILRHLSVASGYDNLRARLGLCLLLESLFASLMTAAGGGACRAVDIAVMISEEIEYSEDNTAALIFEIDCRI